LTACQPGNIVADHENAPCEIQVGPVQRIDLPPLYVKDSYVFGLKGAFLTAKDAL
jgi:hypothetical protein